MPIAVRPLAIRPLAVAVAVLALAGVARAERYHLNTQVMTVNDGTRVLRRGDRSEPFHEDGGQRRVVDVVRSGATLTLDGTTFERNVLTVDEALVTVGAAWFEDPAPFADAELIAASFDVDALSGEDMWINQAGIAPGSLDFIVPAEAGRFLIRVVYSDFTVHTYNFHVYEALGKPIEFAGMEFTPEEAGACAEGPDGGARPADCPDADVAGGDVAGGDVAGGGVAGGGGGPTGTASRSGLTPEQVARASGSYRGRFVSCAAGLGCSMPGLTEEGAREVLRFGSRADAVRELERSFGE